MVLLVGKTASVVAGILVADWMVSTNMLVRPVTFTASFTPASRTDMASFAYVAP
jgi:hypothetical protein